MKKILTAFAFVAAVVLLPACASLDSGAKPESPEALKIGWAKRSLAMKGPVPITGQFYLRVSHGQLTPVIVSALAISNEKDAVIFVSVDMPSFQKTVYHKTMAILKKEAPEIPTEKIIINSTHTHAGPSSNDVPTDYPRQVNVTPSGVVQDFIARQVADSVMEAWAKRAPGSIAYGYGFATTGHSRRTVYLEDIGKNTGAAGIAMNGRAAMYGRTNHPQFDGYESGTDAFINLLYTFDKNGKLTGAVINVPCPSQTGEHFWVYYASFWHNVRVKLAAKYGDIGVICQSAAAGDLSPRQLHYNAAEKRRYMLKYKDQIEYFMKNPVPRPYTWWTAEEKRKQDEYDVIELMRSEDIANRIVVAFDEVLSWAGNDKISELVLKHEVRTVQLARRMFPKALVDEETVKHAEVMKIPYVTTGNEWVQLIENSRLRSRRRRVGSILERYNIQAKQPGITTDIHVVRLGDIAFATNRFELFMDYQHRIQARSPFVQTFIVQLVTDKNGVGSYLATVKGEANKGYSATPYCNQVSPKGGQQLVEETLKMLNALKK